MGEIGCKRQTQHRIAEDAERPMFIANAKLTRTGNTQRLSQRRIDEDAKRPEGATYRSPGQARETSDTLG